MRRAVGVGEQLSLVRAIASPRGRSRVLPAVQEATEVDPVALVLVDVGLAHLDRPFEYLVPASMADLAVPGARVRVRFAGQDVDGFVLERRGPAEPRGQLAPLTPGGQPEVVLTPGLLTLCQETAARYAGTLGDVLRLAVPPRHATAEKNLTGAAWRRRRRQVPRPVPGPTTGWCVVLADGIASGEAPAASWLALPWSAGGRRLACLRWQ
jgi:primosomal protein N' (replication factor Y)